ncbi:ataxin-2 homolog isoform X1 [Anopheles moucheti]|uniref:ataxin-2 homolog isoform X1 n=1 Tax=Anopheles moucheti TaxID=186751 RepID=UPI0022F0849F|nr:ataxin-2 homolog isoform X1 [Anopheles moucheti]
MSKRNKTRPGPARTQRQRSIQADGIYNNAPFMHAATSHVGNIVQIQTPAGQIYEGVFRTFSSQFQIVLEMAHRVEIGSDQKPKIIVESFVDRLIFKPNDIVTLAAKDVDPEDATRDTFKTDTAISRCNGTNWLEDRVLEPWDESGDVNGESLEHSLELDSNAEGWDVNDMFLKNEQVYGVQSTFDQSLSGYTVQIQKKDSEEFKVQEQEAEKIANEIENNPVYKERIDIENGDEEAAFAAVVRPNSNASPQPAATQQGTGGAATDKNSNSVGNNSSSNAANSNSNGNNNLTNNTSNSTNNNNNTAMPKYIVPAKRKTGQPGGKLLVRSPSLANSNNNNGGSAVVTAQQQQQQQQQQPPSPQAPHKNSYGQMMSQQQQQQQQQQQPPPGGQQHGGGGGGGGMGHPPGPQYGMHPNQSPYGHAQHQQQQQPPPQHGQPSVMNSNKMNGDGRGDMAGGPPGGGGGAGGNMNVNSNQKPLPQRGVRQYANAPAPVTYSEPPPSLNPQQMPGQMQPMSTKPPMHLTHPHHAVVPPHMPPPNVVPAEHVVIQQHPMAMPPPVQQQQPPPPQQQQQPQVQAPPPQPQRTVVVRNRDMEIDNLRKFGQDFKLAPPQQQPPMPNVHQQPPPPAPQQQQQQQPQQGPPPHNVVVQQAPPPQQQPDHATPPSLDSSPPLVNSQQQGKMVVSAPHSEPPPQAAPLNQQQNQASQTASGMVVVPAQMSSQSPHLVQQPPPVVQQQPGQQQPVVVGGSPPQQQQPQTNHVGGAPGVASAVTGPGGQNAVAGSVTPNAAPNGNANGVGTPDGTSANGSASGEQKPGAAPKKPFTLNPTAKPFIPRSPSTPNPSRHTSSSPHTPQTPGPAALTQGSFQPPSPHVLPQQFVMSYVVNPSSFPTAQQHQQVAQQTRIRNGRQGSYRNDIFPVGASQMQVAAATGQPLLAPNPIQMITTQYGPTIHQPFQAAPPFHQRYIYDTPQPAPLQYLAATPPSTTPSPGQPHQQYHPGPQPSPAGGGPPTYQALHHQQPTPYPISVCPMPQVVPAIYQNMQSAPQPNHHQQNLHVMHVAQHPSAQ